MYDSVKKIQKEFPLVFGGENKIPVVLVGDGWLGLVRELCRRLMPLIEDTDGVQPVEIREEHGSMVISLSGSRPVVDLVDEIEGKSSETCWVCGYEGRVRFDLTHPRPYCDKHYIDTIDKQLAKKVIRFPGPIT